MSIQSVQAQKKWRLAHPEKNSACQRKYSLAYYYRNQEAHLEYLEERDKNQASLFVLK